MFPPGSAMFLRMFAVVVKIRRKQPSPDYSFLRAQTCFLLKKRRTDAVCNAWKTWAHRERCLVEARQVPCHGPMWCKSCHHPIAIGVRKDIFRETPTACGVSVFMFFIVTAHVSVACVKCEKQRVFEVKDTGDDWQAILSELIVLKSDNLPVADIHRAWCPVAHARLRMQV